MSKYNAIVLSGGGLKGFGMLGGLQYLYDQKLLHENVKYYSGTSIGSVICYFIAIGYTPIEMIIYCITNQVFDKYDINSFDFLNGKGIYNFSIFYNHLEKMTIDKIGYLPTLLDLFNKMNKVFYICSFNISQKKKEYICYQNYPNMLCIEAIRLSCSLPFIFEDCIYNNEYYIDGGIVDNCPFSVILKYDDANMIIFNTNTKDNHTQESYSKLINKFYTIIMIPINELQDIQFKNLKENCKLITLELVPKIYEFNITNSEKLELFSTGYNTTKILLTN